MEKTTANEGVAGGVVDAGIEDVITTSPRVHHPSVKEGTAVSAFLLLGRLKGVIHEVVSSLENATSALSVDDCIAVTEEGLRALKKVKVDRRIEYRRHLNLNTIRQNVVSPTNREMDGAENAESSALMNGDPPSTLPSRGMQISPKHKKVSPKRMVSENHPLDGVEAARQASALRSEERQRRAEEKRLEKLHVMKTKLEAAGERGQLAKQRRTQAEERMRNDVIERQENGARRSEEAREQTKERARRSHSRVEEVRLNYSLRQQTKALLLDRKMTDVEHNQEQKREGLHRIAQERNDAILAAAERRRNLSQERVERQLQREQQRRENLRRLEEQKRMEKDLKEQRAEELEKRVHQRQREATAEAEARNRKAEERIQQSAQLREEQREKLRAKLGKQEQKIKEVRQRREREGDTRPTIQELMPAIAPQEEEQLAQRMAKVLAASARQAKSFIEAYQKECTLSAKDVNRSKLRSIFTRLGSSTALVQFRQSLHDLLGTADLVDVDHEYMRYYNAYEIIIRVMMDARRGDDSATFRLAYNALMRFFNDPAEGRQHVLVFVRAGNVAQVLVCIREEIKGLRRHSHSVPLGAALDILQLCLDRIVTDAQTNVRLISVREQLLTDLDTASAEKYCIAVTRVCTEEEDLVVVYSAARLLHLHVCVLSKRKADCPAAWFRQVACAFFALLQNILTPNGFALSETSPPLSARRMTIVFIVFRVLNCLARWHLQLLQDLLHDTVAEKGNGAVHADPHNNAALKPPSPPPAQVPGGGGDGRGGVATGTGTITQTELFHVLSGFFAYVHAHPNLLETIPTEKPSPANNGSGECGAAEAATARGSFEEALRFGVTHAQLPPFPAAGSESKTESSYHLRAALHECLLLITYLCIQDGAIQGMFAWGKDKSLLSRILTAMPFQYFTSARHILYPVVLAIVVDAADNMTLARSEMDLQQVLTFVEEEHQALPKKAKMYAQQRHKELHLPPEEPVKAAVAQPVRWADLLDDDDDDIAGQDTKNAQSATQGTTQTHPFSTVEKQRLCKLLKNPAVTPCGFFKMERRFPLALWPAAIEQLTKAVEESKTS